jgi:hypothetical protein
MRRHKLTDTQKAFVVNGFVQGKQTMTALAVMFGVHRKTIQRVLLEKGVIAPPGQLTQDEQQMLDMLKAHNLNPYKLRQVLSAPVLNQTNLVRYLEQQEFHVLASLFYGVHMTKLHVEQPKHNNVQGLTNAACN